ncbi:hypothetical protein RLIN73S_04628 [Rhodanobacter lindaniclasticus]
MDPQTALFQQHRQRLFGLAYRMLGTPGDAEDVLHDAWLRWHAQDTAALDDPEAWLVTVTTRLALDRLRRAKTERAHYPGPWLPEPLIEAEDAGSDTPEATLERDQSLTLSFLTLLERLGPDERAAFLLNEVFDYSHAEAAAILGIAENACRQRVHRARARLREDRPRYSVDARAQQRLLQRFVAAMEQAHTGLAAGLVRRRCHPHQRRRRCGRRHHASAARRRTAGATVPADRPQHAPATAALQPAHAERRTGTAGLGRRHTDHRDLDRGRRRAHPRHPRAAPPGQVGAPGGDGNESAGRRVLAVNGPLRPSSH